MSQTEKQAEPWYKDGLRFSCSQCGDCCTGGEGYIWVNQAEMEAIAKQVGLGDDIETFKANYTRKVGIRYSLKEFSNGDCYLFDGKARKCTVYEARPRQCRTWPFWDSNLKSEKAWAETCEVCPGSGQGKLYSLERIEEQRKVFHV